MKKIFLLSLLCILFTTSCTITEEIHFSDEESGNVKYTIDLSMFKEYASDESLNLAEKIDSNFLSTDSIMKKIDGIKNISHDFSNEEYKVTYSYSFNSLEALNKSFNAQKIMKKEKSFMSSYRFKKSWGRLVFEKPASPRNDSTIQQLGELQSMFRYKFILSFDEPIKKFKVKKGSRDIVEQAGENIIIQSGNMFDVFPRNKTKWIIKTK